MSNASVTIDSATSKQERTEAVPYGKDLDPSLYHPTEEQVAFFKQQTGIQSDEELKEHVLAVQKEAWEVVQYVCIRAFGFMTLSISQHPAYPELLKIGKERPGAIYLEFASCFGNDARKAIADGSPRENVVCTDIEKTFWDLGHKLFKTTQESFSVTFVEGSVFDSLHIAPHEPFYAPSLTPRPVLATLTSLTPLQGHVSVLHNGAFFHLFTREEQIAAAKALASLLSPLPGSLIFGTHVTLPQSGVYTNPRGKDIYCFSPEEWIGLWNGGVFEKGTVEVTTKLEERESASGSLLRGYAGSPRRLIWSVKRI